MHFKAMLKTLSILLMLFSISMLPPIAIGLWYEDSDIIVFLTGFLITVITGFILWITTKNNTRELRTRDGFLMVVLVWVVLSFFSALPLIIEWYPSISITDTLFETVSGITTTGASILSDINSLPHATLYYRQQLHLFGGIGIIVLAVAVLPMLGIGGMQLYRAEIAGPMKTSKLTPRITQTAKALWYIYFGLALLCALSYWLAGMPLFNAVGESFSTISTGGFAQHNSSFAYYHNTTINIVAIVFMFLGSVNFSLHFQVLKFRRFSAYYKDPEVRAYLKLIVTSTFVIFFSLVFFRYSHQLGTDLLNALFTTVSISSTTGLTTTNFSIWPSFLPFLMMFLALVGACGGSTSGGIKIIRCLLLKEQAKRELNCLIHPKAVWAVKLGDNVLPDRIIQAIWGFIAFFIVLFVFLLLLLLASGVDFTTSFGALAACISNTGASIGNVAANYAHLPTPSKWICIFAMLIGRLEIFTVMLLFTPAYWKN